MIGEDGKMTASTKAELETDHLLRWFQSYGVNGPWSCLQCGATIRKPRWLKPYDGRRYATLTFCSQDCLDAWRSRFKSGGTRWEKYNQDGVLIGYVIPKKGFVSLEEIEERELSSDMIEEDQGADE